MNQSPDVRFDPSAIRRSEFSVIRDVPLRWDDQDALGHVNNAVHYALFDTAVTGWLFDAVGDIRLLPALGVVAETSCRYVRELRFPSVISVGLAVERLGGRSVTYRLALFDPSGEAPAAIGTFVHVYVDPSTRRPVSVPEIVRSAVERLVPPRLSD